MGKIILTIVITVLMLLFAIFYFGGIIFVTFAEGIKLLPIILLLIAIGIAGAIIYNMIERIKEIKGGDENDISKY
ncbi:MULTISPECIES: hypothetical protein [Clostridium]|uniref:Uncharacterized protein n=1 Tax=Clostridium sulfidigenes TaxID=318464 RepID=A0A084JDF4_9CLOT|nr:hypothetical protein [Clostridium sulfidigenes]KEZ86988.1 hypothetical protein IO99_06980 [Clostridium sulfidigenes]HBA03901.1 hypothetical protein [Clostridium sp.]HCO73613.1 hypothetical protein [Clostridium sp.]